MPINTKNQRERDERGIVGGRGGRGGEGGHLPVVAGGASRRPPKSIVPASLGRRAGAEMQDRETAHVRAKETDETMGIFLGPAQSSPQPIE
jgi:hypothetical protein